MPGQNFSSLRHVKFETRAGVVAIHRFERIINARFETRDRADFFSGKIRLFIRVGENYGKFQGEISLNSTQRIARFRHFSYLYGHS